MSRVSIISKVYNDPSGFGSLKPTLADASKMGSTIKLDDVKHSTEEHVKRKKQAYGQNLLLGSGPHHD